MKQLLNWHLYAITFFLYFCYVSIQRIYDFTLGRPDWHRVMFEYSDQPLLDWWKYLIPCFIISYILIRFVPTKVRWIILGLVGAFTLFLITISYF